VDGEYPGWTKSRTPHESPDPGQPDAYPQGLLYSRPYFHILSPFCLVICRLQKCCFCLQIIIPGSSSRLFSALTVDPYLIRIEDLQSTWALTSTHEHPSYMSCKPFKNHSAWFRTNHSSSHPLVSKYCRIEVSERRRILLPNIQIVQMFWKGRSHPPAAFSTHEKSFQVLLVTYSLIVFISSSLQQVRDASSVGLSFRVSYEILPSVSLSPIRETSPLPKAH
jgi:hypothetical protein